MRRGRELVALLEARHNPRAPRKPPPADAILTRAAGQRATVTPAEGNMRFAAMGGGPHTKGTLPVDDSANRREMTPELKRRLVPDELWAMVEPMIPPTPVRSQGGGRPRIGPRNILIAIVYVLMADVSWRRLPNTLGVTTPTVYRRYLEWHESGLWTSLLDASQHQEGEPAAWTGAIAQAALNRPVLTQSGDQSTGRR